MTNEQIRIVVAEELGWREDTEHTMGETIKVWRNAICPFRSSLPDYPNSLDACAEFENSLDYANGDRQAYGNILKSVVWRDNGNLPLSQCRGTHRATPFQRCEAFLRMRGKWKEDGK